MCANFTEHGSHYKIQKSFEPLLSFSNQWCK